MTYKEFAFLARSLSNGMGVFRNLVELGGRATRGIVGSFSKPKLGEVNGVNSICPECKAVTNFHALSRGDVDFHFERMQPESSVWMERFSLLRCNGCGRGALGTFLVTDYNIRRLLDFYPKSSNRLPLPKDTPAEVVSEFREAEQCCEINAYRAASAMLRSSLEKTLELNGYTHATVKSATGRADLYNRIELAYTDGILSAVHWDTAQNVVRALGNDVLHGGWREVKYEEFEEAQIYVHRIIENFYQSRQAVVTRLQSINRLTN